MADCIQFLKTSFASMAINYVAIIIGRVHNSTTSLLAEDIKDECVKFCFDPSLHRDNEVMEGQ